MNHERTVAAIVAALYRLLEAGPDNPARPFPWEERNALWREIDAARREEAPEERLRFLGLNNELINPQGVTNYARRMIQEWEQHLTNDASYKEASAAANLLIALTLLASVPLVPGEKSLADTLSFLSATAAQQRDALNPFYQEEENP